MREKVVKGILWLGGASIVSQAATWFSTIIVARILNPADYGLIGLAGIYIGFAETLNEFGVGASIVQRKDLSDQDVRGLYSIAILIGLTMTLLTISIAPFLAHFFGEERLTDLVRLLSLTFLINSAKSVQRNLMIREMRFAELAKMDGGARVLTSLGALATALAGFGVWTLVVQYLLQNFIVLLWAFAYERRLPGRITDLRRLREILSFGAGITGSGLLFSVNSTMDSFIVGKVLGKTLLGHYSFAQVLANKPFERLLTIFNQVFFPLFSSVQDDRQKMREYFHRIMEKEMFILTPIFVFLMVAGDDLVRLLLGAKWEPMILPLRVFAGVALFKYLENRVNVILTALGKSRPQFVYMAVLVTAMSGALLAGSRMYGIAGVLGAWALVYPAVLICYLHYVFRFMPVSWRDLCCVAKTPLLSAVVMIFAVMPFWFVRSEHILLMTILKFVMSFSAYLAFSYVTNGRVVMELLDYLPIKRRTTRAV